MASNEAGEVKLNNILSRVREPDHSSSLLSRIMTTSVIAAVGAGIGVLQKWLDSMAINELPMILQRIDLINYFGRLAVWILIAVIISVLSKTPLRASVNTFAFFIGMIAGYYLYCNYVLGFLPVR